MAVINTSGSISSYLNNIYEIALLTAREQSVMAPLVANFSGTGMNQRVWSAYTGGTFGTVTEATDTASSSQAFTPNAAGSVTPVLYAATYTLSDLRLASDPFSVAADAGRDLGQLAAVGVDSALVTLFATASSFTAGTLAGTIAITWAGLLKQASNLRAKFAPGPYKCVLAPRQWYDLSAGTPPTLFQSQKLMEELGGAFYQASWANIDFYVDANITQSLGAGGGTAYGALFSREAALLDIRRAFRIEAQRDASIGGGVTELNASMVFNVAVYRPTFGVSIAGCSA